MHGPFSIAIYVKLPEGNTCGILMKFYVIKGIVVSHQITPAETGCLLIDFVVILFLFLFLFFLGS